MVQCPRIVTLETRQDGRQSAHLHTKPLACYPYRTRTALDAPNPARPAFLCPSQQPNWVEQNSDLTTILG